jgi:hypothetical protein
MNDYITLDGKRYKTTKKSWTPETVTPMQSKDYLNGDLNATFGATSLLMWEGVIIAPSTAPTLFGSIKDIDKTLVKRETVSFTDHHGTTYANVHLIGPFAKHSLFPNWDVAGNPIYVSITIKAKYG